MSVFQKIDTCGECGRRILVTVGTDGDPWGLAVHCWDCGGAEKLRKESSDWIWAQCPKCGQTNSCPVEKNPHFQWSCSQCSTVYGINDLGGVQREEE